MTLRLKSLLAISLLSSPTVFANSFEGHRVGLGFTATEVEDVWSGEDYSANGMTFEYGYDINRIVGVNVSYNKGSGDVSFIDIDTSTFKIDTDIGYTFQLTDFTIKPYGAIGFSKYKEEFSIVDNKLGSWSDSTIFVGVGTRAVFNNHFYTDLRVDFMNLEDEGEDVFVDQFSFTVGYKF
ncbi:porin family protein [Aliivibrio sifiae]|uniref:Outer membrane protein beta-barrel domain-containing protein n=1 Tax=Aliivibrio sifiae TaxID=566293 RepID=A0A2S7X625_9GAMM|nr:porin family protein [Aliivibrio sifiae]PQJ86757.1 hypothetical protein BTO23_11465 [Aliivibrio sifiae]GLR74137.1 hypothetical protein GCM10007855_10110 [Aliivibrio sifiae]